MAAYPQTARIAAFIVGNCAVGQGCFGLLLLAFANRCQRASQAYSTVLAFVVGDLAVFHRKELLVHIERTYVIVTCAAGIVGQDTVAPGSACLYAVTGKVIPIVLVQVRNVHRRIQTVGIVIDGHVVKRAVGGHIIRIVLVVAAAQHADDTALALGVGKSGVGNFQIVAVMDKQYGIISVIAADGVVIKHGISNAGKVTEIVGIRNINGIGRGFVVDDAAVVNKDLALCLTAAGVANVNSRSFIAVGRNVAIKQHIAHVFGSAAAHIQGTVAAIVVAITAGVADKLGVVAILGQLNIRVIADGEQFAAHIHAAAAAEGLVFFKQVARAKGQAALLVVYSTAATCGSAVIGKGASIHQLGHCNAGRFHIQRTAVANGLVICKSVILQHSIIASVGFGFGLFGVGVRHQVDSAALAFRGITRKAVATQGDGVGVQVHRAALILGIVILKGAVLNGGLVGCTVHEDRAAVVIAFHTVVGKGAVGCCQCAVIVVVNGSTRCAADRRVTAERAVHSHQVDIGARKDSAISAGQGHALQLYGDIMEHACLFIDVDKVAAGGGQCATVSGFIVVVLGVVIGQGKGQGVFVQVGYRDVAGEGVAVQVQGGAVLGVVDGHVLGLVAQQVDGGGVSFCILGIRCFHGLDGLVDAEILITANTGGVTASVLPRRGQGVDGLGIGNLLHGLVAGLVVVFQPDELVSVLDTLDVQGLCIGQFDLAALGKQHIACDGAAVQQGVFAHSQGAVGSAQIQVAGQLAGGVIPDDAAHVRALGGREGDFSLGSNVESAAVVGGIFVNFAAGHGKGAKAGSSAHVHRAAINGGVVVKLAAGDGQGGDVVAAGLVACHNYAAVGDGSVVMEAAAIDGQGTIL